jgi:metal-responsive CopG/Arc/MetJ family transcriptional regulator
MASRSASSAKVRITASLNPALVKQIDEIVEKTNAGSRSQLIEYVLGKWCKERKKQKIERQVETYYLSLPDEDRQEDRQWNQIASETVESLWED